MGWRAGEITHTFHLLVYRWKRPAPGSAFMKWKTPLGRKKDISCNLAYWKAIVQTSSQQGLDLSTSQGFHPGATASSTCYCPCGSGHHELQFGCSCFKAPSCPRLVAEVWFLVPCLLCPVSLFVHQDVCQGLHSCGCSYQKKVPLTGLL